ncbi:MAG: prepilin-type N-terminal cleavage/methylation domain-containing protein [Bdellovibrionales bacterium]|nr:prepilin-type N-terminal cleavage/methylation domain-containing protein [Bdellovibrionales bacterium]
MENTSYSTPTCKPCRIAERCEEGFTLIELLTVMVIIGILAAIAIPEYQAYRAQSFDVRALSDLRNVAIGEEAYFLNTERYLSCTGEACTELPGIVALSEGTSLEIVAESVAFAGQAEHVKGSGRVFRWDSANGGLIQE